MKDEIKSLNRSNASFSESTKGKKTYEVEHRNKWAILGLQFPRAFYDNSIPGLELIISILFLMPKHLFPSRTLLSGIYSHSTQ